jgi:MFS transporter, OCT family, solute carrier family 22 (organic cation transporter), member 4/5
LPESPRWLFTHQKPEKALKTLRRIAKSNKKVLPESYENLLLEDIDKTNNNNNNLSSEAQLTNQSQGPLGFFEAFKLILQSKVLLVRTLAIIFNWLTNNLVYYGLTLGTGELKWGSPYLNFALSTTVEFIAILCSQYCFNKFGRKIPYLICMSLAGLILVAVIFIPSGYPELVTVIALIGKFSISLTFNGIYIITAETYPTFIRNTAVSVAQFIARFGAVIAPYINLLVNFHFQVFN